MNAASLTATQAAACLRDGRLTVLELAQSCLDRIREREPLLQAWAHVDAEQVLHQARVLDRAVHRGALHGLPIGIKDVLQTRDFPTQYNSPIYAGSRPGVDAASVRILRAAGALIFGKTTTVEFAATGRRPATRNPHALEHTPGGSSSGSAAAVADGHVPLALCTQTGGSTIRPAAYCGIFAMKPTWNLVSNEGARHFAASLDTLGWCARSAEDLALLYQAFDPEPGIIEPVSVAGLRVAVCRSPVWQDAEDSSRQALERGAGLLRAAGASVSELTLPRQFDSLASLHELLMNAEARTAFWPEYCSDRAQLDVSTLAQVENAAGYTRRRLLEARDAMAACRPLFDRIAAGCDVILTLSAAGEAPRGLASTGPWVFNALWTALHAPCINVPGMRGPQQLPIGLTLTTARHEDRRLLAAAASVGEVFRQ